MARRIRISHRGTRGALGRAVAVTGPPPEAPLTISDLAAWYDSRTDAYLALGGANVTTWLSRAGTLGGVPLSQAVETNQPVRELAVAVMGGRNAIRFDGVDDFLAALVNADWTFLHNNTGATIFTVERFDSTGPADQLGVWNATSASSRGFRQLMRAASASHNVYNGGGTTQNTWVNGTATHYARNVTRWRAWTYGNGEQTSVVSAGTLTNADTAGQVAGTGAPALPVRLSTAGSSQMKGYVPQVLFYKRVLTAPEVASLAAWAAAEYGVAA